ncbi:MAG TPA: DoxX family protein [Rhizomicrobium sp.]|nr:DoxX family protein [Rhizomicrobium sp.]
MSLAETISPLIGRWLIAWFFLSEAYTRASSWSGTIEMMAAKHIPDAPPLFALALLVMVAGGLALLLGFHVRHGALALFGFTIVTTVVMHDYWKIANLAERATEYDLFARNMAIAGGLLLIVGMGAGPLAIDNRMDSGAKKKG